MSIELAINSWRFLFRYQRKGHYVSKAYETTISIAESHLLGDIWALPSLSVAAYADLLRLDAKVVSRIIQRLESRGLVQSIMEDGSKLTTLSPKGGRAATAICQAANEAAEIFAHSLFPEEVQRLERYFSEVASKLGASEPPILPLDVPLQRGIRHITRAYGGLGRNVLGTGLSANMFQILMLLDEAPDGLSVDHIAKLVHVDQSAASRTISVIMERGFVSRSPGKEDKRMAIIKKTPQGRRDFGAMLKTIGSRILEYFKNEPTQLEDYVTLLERFAGTSDIESQETAHVLYGTLGYSHDLLYETIEEFRIREKLPLIWQAAADKELASADRMHRLSLKFEKDEVCLVLFAEYPTHIRFTHIFAAETALSSFWAEVTFRTIEDLVSRRLSPGKRVYPLPKLVQLAAASGT